MQNGIELVIVAPGTAERQPHEGGAHHVSDVVQQLLPPLHQVAGVVFVGEMAIEAGRHQRLRIIREHLVTRQLLLDETVVRLVLIEALNHVVAIAPDIGPRFIGFEALAIGIARQIEPMARPAFAIVRRGQQRIDHFGEGIGRLVIEKGLRLFGRGG